MAVDAMPRSSPRLVVAALRPRLPCSTRAVQNGRWIMRIINGKQSRLVDAATSAAWAGAYPDITIDLGAGDGRFVRHFAERHPERGAIALDLCEANLRTASRKAPGNALFVV